MKMIWYEYFHPRSLPSQVFSTYANIANTTEVLKLVFSFYFLHLYSSKYINYWEESFNRRSLIRTIFGCQTIGRRAQFHPFPYYTISTILIIVTKNCNIIKKPSMNLSVSIITLYFSLSNLQLINSLTLLEGVLPEDV